MMTNYSNIFQDLSNLPDKCIYGLFNDQDKKVYIGYSSNTIRTLYSNISNLKYSNLTPDWGKLEFRVIEPIEDSNRLKVRYQYWVSHYSNEGWSMYRDFKAIEYKVRIDILNDETRQKNGRYLLYVKLLSRGRSEVVVGVFDSLSECNEFVESNYKTIKDIHYSNNELTNEYRKSLK
jgi:hypothetical protein